MNTPDDTPKNGDFVAYLADLERRKLAAHPHRPPQIDVVPGPHATTGAQPGAKSAAAPGTSAARIAPVALAVIGFAFLIAGFGSDGGIFLVLLGAFLVWQAVRAAMRNARATEPGRTAAAQRIATLLAGHAQRKRSR